MMKIPSNVVKEMAPLLVVVVLSVLVLPIAGVQVGNNTSRWLTEANYLSKAKGSGPAIQGSLTVRRPLLPLMIAAAYKIGGKSVHSAVVLVRIFFAFELVLIYLIGRVFYNAAVGLLSFGLVLTSFGINSIAKSVDTDIVQPFFILLFVLMYFLALRHERRVLALLAGLSLGLAFLIKETAVFCLGIPIGIIIFAPKRKKWPYGKIFLWFLATLLVPVVLWVIYMFAQTGSLSDVLKRLYTDWTYRIGQGSAPLTKWFHLFSTGLKKAGLGYYHGFLQKVTPLAFLLPMSWIFVLIRGILKKKNSDLILGIFCGCALPIILQLGYEGDRIGQTTSVYMILYISLAVCVVSASRSFGGWFANLGEEKKKLSGPSPSLSHPAFVISTVLIAVIGIFMMGKQLFSRNLSTWTSWTAEGDSLALFIKKPFEIYGRYTIFQEEAAQWLKKNAPSAAKIMADGYTNEALDFFDVAPYNIPSFRPVREIRIYQGLPVNPEKVRLLFFFTYSRFDSGIERNRAVYKVPEEDILAVLKNENPKYLVFSSRSLFFKYYFEKASWARLVFDNERVVIFEIQTEKLSPVSFPKLGVNEAIDGHVAWLEKNQHDEYHTLLKLIESLGLTLQNIKDTPLRIPNGQTY
jgi:hypothetical protein